MTSAGGRSEDLGHKRVQRGLPRASQTLQWLDGAPYRGSLGCPATRHDVDGALRAPCGPAGLVLSQWLDIFTEHRAGATTHAAPLPQRCTRYRVCPEAPQVAFSNHFSLGGIISLPSDAWMRMELPNMAVR